MKQNFVFRDHLEAQRSSDRSDRSSSLEAKTTSTTLTVETRSVTTECKTLTLEPNINPPTIVMSSVTPPAISPVAGSSLPLPGTSTSGSSSPVGSPNVSTTPTHPLLTTRRDSTTQVNRLFNPFNYSRPETRPDSIGHQVFYTPLIFNFLLIIYFYNIRTIITIAYFVIFQCYYKTKEVSPNKLSRLTRQSAAIDESMPPSGRRGSQPTLSPDPDDGGINI